jgi:hypothetical protein
MGILKVFKCKECDENISVSTSNSYGDIIVCSCCGLEYELKNVKDKMELVKLELDGEDWGE